MGYGEDIWEEADQLYEEICTDEEGGRVEEAGSEQLVRYLAAYGYIEEEQTELLARLDPDGTGLSKHAFRACYTAFITDLTAVNRAIARRAIDAGLVDRGVDPAHLPAYAELFLDDFVLSATLAELQPLLASRWADILREKGYTLQARLLGEWTNNCLRTTVA